MRFEAKFAELCEAATPRLASTPRTGAVSPPVCADGFAIPTPKLGGTTPGGTSTTPVSASSPRPRRQSDVRIENWGRMYAEPTGTGSANGGVAPAEAMCIETIAEEAASVPPQLPQVLPHFGVDAQELSQHISQQFAPLEQAAAAVDAASSGSGKKKKEKAPKKEKEKKKGKEEGSAEGVKPRCRKNSKPLYWTPEDHEKFLRGLEKFGMQDHLGAGGAELMSLYMGNRSVLQIKSHAQKYFSDMAAGKVTITSS